MEMKEFQAKLAELCSVAAANDKRLRAVQVEGILKELTLGQEQLQHIYRYLKSQGIQVEGYESNKDAKESLKEAEELTEKESAEKKENPCLTEEDKEYLRTYLESLRSGFVGDERMLKFMILAAEYVTEMYRDGMHLPDLIQDASVSLLDILADDTKELSDAELAELLRKGVKQAVDAQDEQNFEDDCLVARVQKLDTVMKELTDGEGSNLKFDVEEVAIMLDLDLEEMKDIIRLTGDL